MQSYKLFLEKSSLSKLNVPQALIQIIQRNYEIPSDAEWKEIEFKMDLENIIRNYQDYLFVEITNEQDKVKVYGTYYNKGKKYFLDRFKLETDSWDENWIIEKREKLSMTQLLKNVQIKNNIYKLKDNYHFEYTEYIERKVELLDSEFEDFTEKFKNMFMTSFNKILKKMYGSQAEIIKDVIIRNLAKLNVDGLNEENIREILDQNINLAKKSEFLKSKALEDDPMKLKSKHIQYNSLTIFDQYLFTFEDAVSNEHDEFWNIQDLCEKFTTEKVITAFMYFLYSGELLI